MERPVHQGGAPSGRIARVAAWLAATSIRRPGRTLAASALLLLASLFVVVDRFALDTDVTRLFPSEVAWRQAELRMDAAFPQRIARIAVVIDGATPFLADRAAAALEAALAARTDRLREVSRPSGEAFLRRHALLYQDLPEVQATTERLVTAQPLLGTLAADPSLRGLAGALRLLAEGVSRDEGDAAALARTFDALAATAGNPRVPLDWTALLGDGRGEAADRRRYLLVRPALDFEALAPGAAATETIRAEIARLGLIQANGVRVRLTGETVMGDEEFETVFGGAIAENLLSLASVALLLWLGLRSARLILPLLGVLVLGLAATTALGLLVVGPFNPLSIAFAVLFIGLGVDFGIQYAVAYREARHRTGEAGLGAALIGGARAAGPAIALAALALCAGFLAFLPTDYRGVADLGLIASLGMLVAVLLSLTTLPALLCFTRPRPETAPVGYPQLAPLDRWLRRRAGLVTAATCLVAALAAATLPLLRFDSDIVNLRSPKTEAVATYRELRADPEATPDFVESLAPDLAAAERLAARFAALPEVRSARTLASFVPDGQPAKLAFIEDAASLLGPTLSPPAIAPPPDDAAVVAALGRAAAALRAAARNPSAARLGEALGRLADGAPEARQAFAEAVLPGLAALLGEVRAILGVGAVALDDLPPGFRDDWLLPDGRARVEVRPRVLNDPQALGRFVRAVRAVDPLVAGTAVSISGSAETIRAAFLTAGWLATGLTAVLLLAVLRSARLAALALAPLALAGLLTLAACVALGRPLDLANIIALPLLFAQGVAFDIYYVTAWQAGERALLPSALTRAVLYSALTNGTAFGTLALSPHPGTAGMGVLLTLSLGFALLAVLLTLPALLTRFAPDAHR